MRKVPWYYWEQDSLIIQVWLQPRARCDEILGLYRDRLKIRVTAPPVEGRANTHLIGLLAKTFQVSKKQIRILAGISNRDKRVGIENPVKLLPGIKPPHNATE